MGQVGGDGGARVEGVGVGERMGAEGPEWGWRSGGGGAGGQNGGVGAEGQNGGGTRG